jgi:hypothetical protein
VPGIIRQAESSSLAPRIDGQLAAFSTAGRGTWGPGFSNCPASDYSSIVRRWHGQRGAEVRFPNWEQIIRREARKWHPREIPFEQHS